MILQVDHLDVGYGAIKALHGVSLAINRGEIVALIGSNGAGKSTLLRLLAGLRRPDAGCLAWAGVDIADDPTSHALRVAYLGEHNAVKPALTAAENLRFTASITGGAVMAALEAMALGPLAEVPARLLSAGQRRRLALARLALGDAALWLLDEPTLGLDTASVGRLGDLLAAHRAQGGLVVAATHLALPLPGAETLRLGA